MTEKNTLIMIKMIFIIQTYTNVRVNFFAFWDRYSVLVLEHINHFYKKIKAFTLNYMIVGILKTMTPECV